ncbi:MAG: glutamate synthase subunit beta [Chloroflexi bacterium]|nr:glutamate synthase subunit beta [Chloroflexota bacterium]
MAKTTGFIEYERETPPRRSPAERVRNWREIDLEWPEDDVRRQAARCMDCGVPFCNGSCPLGNLIPDWNELVYDGNWQAAIRQLHATNNFPEFTGRLCPAPCEPACTLSINGHPVTIKHIERAIVERAFQEGWIQPEPPETRTEKSIAVVGSGPAGLAVAQQLNRAGHHVTVFERSETVGGLLSLGVPEFKLEKWVVQRRVRLLEEEGIAFRTNTDVGVHYPEGRLLTQFDAVCLTGGSTVPRDLRIPGRELAGVHFAMEYLTQQNRRLRDGGGQRLGEITAAGKNVVIIGGGDTGADCLGTAHRQGASHVVQFEIMQEPPPARTSDNPWPQWPAILRYSSAHEEGGERRFSILSKSLSGEDGRVRRLHATRVRWHPASNGGRPAMEEVPGSEFTIDAELILLAMGFVHPQREGLLTGLGVELDEYGNVKTDPSSMSSLPGVFACGDMSTGQSLVVRAIADGRQCARHMDEWLMGRSDLPAVRSYARPGAAS